MYAKAVFVVLVSSLAVGFALTSGCDESARTATWGDDTNNAPDAPGSLPEIGSLWDYRDPLKTEIAFRQVLPQARESGNDAYLAELLTQLSRALGMQGKFIEAHRTLDQAEQLITDDMTRVKLMYLLERGRVFNSSQQVDFARPLFLEAWQLARRTQHDMEAIDAAHMLGICETGPTALAWNEEALELAESSPDPQAKGWLGPMYNNIGWTYHDMGRLQDALAMFEKDAALRKARNDTRGELIARWSVARCLRSMERYDEALERQQTLLNEYEALGEPAGFVYEELGECTWALGRETEARRWFAKAYEELSQDPFLQANEAARLQRLRDLGARGAP